MYNVLMLMLMCDWLSDFNCNQLIHWSGWALSNWNTYDETYYSFLFWYVWILVRERLRKCFLKWHKCDWFCHLWLIIAKKILWFFTSYIQQFWRQFFDDPVSELPLWDPHPFKLETCTGVMCNKGNIVINMAQI